MRVLSPLPVPCYSSDVSHAVSLLGVVRSGLLVASMPLLPMEAAAPVLQLLEASSSISTKSLSHNRWHTPGDSSPQPQPRPHVVYNGYPPLQP